MELFLEIVFEFLFEGIIEVINNKKVSKWIRYPLFMIVTLIYTCISLLFFSLSFSFIRESLLAFLILFIIGVVLLIMFFLFIRKLYISK